MPGGNSGNSVSCLPTNDLGSILVDFAVTLQVSIHTFLLSNMFQPLGYEKITFDGAYSNESEGSYGGNNW